MDKRKKGPIKAIRGETFVMRRAPYSLIIGKMEDIKEFAATMDFSIRRKAQKSKDAIGLCSTFARKIGWKIGRDCIAKNEESG